MAWLELYQASLMPLMLSNYGGGTVADIAEAIKSADNDADVLNMSLGGSGESQLMKRDQLCPSKGVVIIAAAGNENRNAASYPARYPHVMGVAALDAAGEKPYSNFGAGVDISAPGGGAAVRFCKKPLTPKQGKRCFLASKHQHGSATLPVLQLW